LSVVMGKGEVMIQFQMRAVVKYGKFREYHSAMEQLNEIARLRGWAAMRLFVPVAGLNNEYIVQAEYPNLAEYERENAEFSSDAEAMKVFRSTSELVIEGTSRSELFDEATTIQ
jgi:hypothetical protein